MNDIPDGVPRGARGAERLPDRPDWGGVLEQMAGPEREQALLRARDWLDTHKARESRDGLLRDVSEIYHDGARPDGLRVAAVDLLLEAARELMDRRATYHQLSFQ